MTLRHRSVICANNDNRMMFIVFQGNRLNVKVAPFTKSLSEQIVNIIQAIPFERGLSK